MFSRSRRKIILAIMGSLILLFAITLSVILFASFREVRQENMDMLKRHVELYYLEMPFRKRRRTPLTPRRPSLPRVNRRQANRPWIKSRTISFPPSIRLPLGKMIPCLRWITGRRTYTAKTI